MKVCILKPKGIQYLQMLSFYMYDDLLFVDLIGDILQIVVNLYNITDDDNTWC